jgi:hypothetical protein
MGPLFVEKLPDTEDTPCHSGHQVEQVTLELPPGRHLAAVPTGLRVETDHLRYTSQWTVDGQTVTARREFTTTIDQYPTLADDELTE